MECFVVGALKRRIGRGKVGVVGWCRGVGEWMAASVGVSGGAVVFWVVVFWGRVGMAACPKSASGLQSYEAGVARGAWQAVRYQEPFPYLPLWPDYRGQTLAWRTAMKKAGERLQKRGVRRIYLVHGTFVGADGLGVVRLLDSVFPKLSWWLHRMQRRIKRMHDSVAQDHGNFTEGYARLLEEALGGKLPTKRFLWSSENHHLARLLAVWRFLLQMAEDQRGAPLKKGERLLLVGHSHAGQVFALLTHLRNASPESVLLWKILLEWWGKEAVRERARLEKALEVLRGGSLDLVTLGTPVRYRWRLRSDDRLLHLINHRPTEDARTKEAQALGGYWSGLWHTREGDYVQQLGIAGADLLANTPMSLRLNREMSEVLGAGADPVCLRELLRHRTRLHERGQHLLVDYGDASPSLFFPNALQTIFGHGVYTEFKTMRFLFDRVMRSL